MENIKVLIFEAPWSTDIEMDYMTSDIYKSAETLLRLGSNPVRIITRPLISSTYLQDIEKFVNLPCNEKGYNVVVFSAHGDLKRSKGRRLLVRRQLVAFDGNVNISADAKEMEEYGLQRSVIILDSCKLGSGVKSFAERCGALGVIGFEKDVDWVDSSVFVLATLFNFHQDILHLKRAHQSTFTRVSKAEKVMKHMVRGSYASLAESLGVQAFFGGEVLSSS